MRKRRLGDTDLELTVIGLGTWAIGGDGWDYGWGPQAEHDSLEAIREALELGINWIDTAAVYGLGRGEELVGKAVRESGRKDIAIATKCGLLGDVDGHISPRLKPESIVSEAEASLRRLGIDCIDLYQIHWPNPPGEIDAAWQTLQKLKEQGKIRWAGVSNFSARQLESISKHGTVSSLQPPYSLIKRDIEKDIIPWCLAHNCGVVAYSPLQCGALTGKVTKEWVEALPDSDWRKRGMIYFQDPKLSALIEFVEELKTIAQESGHTPAELATAWVLEQPGITSAIVGARKRGQFSGIVRAADWTLSGAEKTAVEGAYQRYLKVSK